MTGQKVAGPKKKSVFLPPRATVYNENFAKSYPPFDKSKVEKYEKIREYDRSWFSLFKLREYKKLKLQAKDLLNKIKK